MPRRRAYEVAIAPPQALTAGPNDGVSSRWCAGADVGSANNVGAAWARPSTSRRRSTTSTTCRTSGTRTRRSRPTCSPAGAGCGATTSCFLTGTDEHGLKVQRAAEAQGVDARRSGPTETSAPFRDAWDAPRHRQRRLHPHDRAPPHAGGAGSSSRPVYDNGDIELGTYEGLYCVGCEAYYTEDELVDGNCPIHGTPVEHVTEENYFFQLSRYEDRLLEHYTEHPEAVQPDGKRNEVLGFIKQGLQDFSMSRTSITWGIPLPWDPTHVTYVWFDALINYCTAVGLRPDDAERLRPLLAGRLPPHRQGHPPLPRRLLAGDAHGGRAGACRSACSRTASCSSAARR